MASFEKMLSATKGERWRAHVFRQGVRTSRVFENRPDAEAWAKKTERALSEGIYVRWRKRHSISQIDAPLNPNDLLTESEIQAIAVKFQILAGVYFLLLEGRVVYVGQSLCVHDRIIRHLRNPDKKFDSFSYIEVNAKRLDAVETQYIEHFRPEYNFDKRGILRTPANSLELNLKRGNVKAIDRMRAHEAVV